MDESKIVKTGSHKVEVIFNHYGEPPKGKLRASALDSIERIVLVDGEEIFRDKQKSSIYNKEKSHLREFENWANVYHSKKSDCIINDGPMYSREKRLYEKRIKSKWQLFKMILLVFRYRKINIVAKGVLSGRRKKI